MNSFDRSQSPTSKDRQFVHGRAVWWARQVMTDSSSIFLDTETTGLDNRAEIVEVSLVDIDGKALLDTLVRPQQPIPPDAVRVHGISNQMVQDAPEWVDVFPELERIIKSRRVVVYNAEFDARMVAQMNARHSIPTTFAGWQCAMNHYSLFAGVWHSRYNNYRWHRLDAAMERFGHPPGGHRALADALACRLVVQGMAGSGS